MPVPTNEDLQKFVPELGRQLLDTSLPLAKRFRALFTLRNIGGKAAIDAIAAGFQDESELLKHEFAYCLGQMQDEYAVAHLVAVLKDQKQEPVVRHEAGEALAALGRADLLELLVEYSKDQAIEVAETCEIGMRRVQWITSEQGRAEFDSLPPSPYHSVDPAPPCADTSVPELRNKLMDEGSDLFDRYRALFALRNKGGEDSVLAICEGFSEPKSALFRHEIAYVLGQMSHEASVPALAAVLENESEHPMVRHEAAEALGSIATDPCMPVLNKYLKDKQRIVAESCEVALDVYESEQAGEFQYANGVEELLAKAPSGCGCKC